MGEFNFLNKYPKRRKLNAKQLLSILSNTTFGVGLILLAGSLYLNPFGINKLKTTYRLNQSANFTDGEITDVWIERDKDGDTPTVYGYEYIFSRKDLGQFMGISYGEKRLKLGTNAQVLFDPNEPYLNRLNGMRVDPNPFSKFYLILGFTTTSILLLVHGLRDFLHKKAYLQCGILVKGRRTTKEEHYERESGYMTIYVYQFEDLNGKTKTISKRSNKLNTFEPTELMLYIPEKPGEAVFLKHCQSDLIPIGSLKTE